MTMDMKDKSTQKKFNNNNNKKCRPFCTHWKMQGHTNEKSYKIHRYAMGYNFKNKNQVDMTEINQGG